MSNENLLIDENELKPVIIEKSYSLSEKPAITPDQFKAIFTRTPPKHIHKRPGRGKKEFEYVTGVYVKKMLNYITGWKWNFEIVDKGEVKAGDKVIQVWVQGKLTINNAIIKTQFGGAEVKYLKDTNVPLDYANDLKAAATDALKKCASELGIASDVYGRDEFREITFNEPVSENKIFEETFNLLKKVPEGKRNQAIDNAVKSGKFNDEQINKLMTLICHKPTKDSSHTPNITPTTKKEKQNISTPTSSELEQHPAKPRNSEQ